MVDEVARDCDVALLLVDRVTGWTEMHDELKESLVARKRPTLLVGTKSDLRRAEERVWPPPEAPEEWPNFTIAAQKGVGLEALLDGIVEALPESPALYDEARIQKRARLIAYGIDARRQRFPDERPYDYQPLADADVQYRWNDNAKADLKDYNLLDLSI